jgi:hypothetical protein
MKIRSLLLGSLAAVGLSTGGAFAADLGVLPSFDVCDDLGLSGLTISSEDNCLVITGGVEYKFTWGDYTGDSLAGADFFFTDYETNVDSGDGINDWKSELDAWLQFAATSQTDFGKAKAVIKITNDNDEDGYDSEEPVFYGKSEGIGTGLKFDEAYVSIGDTTVITAGKTGSIFNSGDDEPLDWLGGFISDANDDDANPGVGFYNGNGVSIDSLGGGAVIQVTHDLGNGFSISGALENLDADYAAGFDTPVGSAIGVVAYSGDGISAHLSVAAFDILVDDAIIENGWAVHAGFAGEFDNFKVVLAGAALSQEDVTFWNVLASASATFDIFTIAGAVEAAGGDEWTGVGSSDTQFGVSGSISAEVTEGVALNLGGRYTDEFDSFNDGIYEIAAGVTADVTETLEASAKVGFMDDGWADAFYGSAGLTWKPGGNYEAGITGTITSEDAYKIETKFKKEFK